MPDELSNAGARIVTVVGLQYGPDHTANDFSAERPVQLQPEPDNKFDQNAMAVRSADGSRRAGHLAREDAAWCARHGRPQHGIVVWEQRPVGNVGDRTSIDILIAPVPISVGARTSGALPVLDAVEKVVTSSSLPPLSVTFHERIAAIRGEPAR